MMKYLLLAYRDENRWAALSAAERLAFEQECRTVERELVRGLHLLAVQHLQTAPALSVRLVDGDVSLSDAAATRMDEQLIQLLLIQARDLNAAIQIAAKMPQARRGSIEVRSIVEGKG